MSNLPPPITERDFRDLEGANKEQVKKRAAPLVEELHAYLNESSCLSDIQRIRHDWNSGVSSRLAFERGHSPTDREHWYTYNTGGRNEAQFNIGLFPEYLRVGLGFEFTEKMFGNPNRVRTVYDAFRGLVDNQQQVLRRFAQDNALQIEWLPKDKAGQGALEYRPTQDTIGWLVRRKKEADWIFVGRLLRRVDDAEILGDPARLRDAMESVFRGFKPLWEDAQKEVARYSRG